MTKHQPSGAAIVADQLVKTFRGGVRALDGVSLRVEPGTVLGLLGPNGAGKTTTVSVLTTLLRPDSGHAEIAGVDVVRDPAIARRLVGLAGQYAAIDESLTGRENLTLVGRLNHLPKAVAQERAVELLDRFDLNAAADRRAKTYSGGMRRRLDLAAALVAHAPVLFLDEPTTGLDPRSRADMWAITEELVAEGLTVLLTTQYLEEADRLADRISVVDRGRVIAEGTARELKAQLGETVVEIRMADADDAAKAEVALTGLTGAPPVRVDVVLKLTTPDGPKLLPSIVGRLNDESLAMAGLVVREPSLDDVFLRLTGHAATEEPAAEGLATEGPATEGPTAEGPATERDAVGAAEDEKETEIGQ